MRLQNRLQTRGRHRNGRRRRLTYSQVDIDICRLGDIDVEKEIDKHIDMSLDKSVDDRTDQ